MENKVAVIRRKSTKNNDLIFDHHIQCILKSGLLLDEDMDIILANYSSDDEMVDCGGFTLFEKLLGVFSVATTLLGFQRKFQFAVTTVTAAPFIILAARRLIDKIRERKQRRNLEILVEATHNITKLNRMIFEYFKARKAIDPTTVCIINPYTKGMKKLIEVFFKEEVNLLYSFRIFIRDFGNYVPSFKEDYAHLENVDLEEFNMSNIDSINDCISYLQRLCDICVLIISNVLTCLALTLCPTLCIKHDINYNEIIENIVPKMKRVAIDCYSNVNKKFDDLKYHYLNRTQAKKHFKKPKPNASTKLQISTYNTMAYTSDILEKSQIIFKKLQEFDLQSLSQKELLGQCILDLRGHAFDYYESLDVLYKLYQININASQNKPIASHLEVKREEENVPKINIIDASFNPSEPSDDEEYELYIGANETSSENTSFSLYEEQESRKFASLLSQELKHKLKSHAQFVAARKKRGIIDDVPELEESIEQAINVQHVVDDPLDIHEPVNANAVMPPPLPPLQQVPFDFGVQNDNHRYTVNSFLDSLKTATKNRNHVEEVFGGDSDEEN